ncbi:diguanylate cyclase [Oxalobacteraceae bacterium OM1]|nr:diguanylate cyclase [Oxalobacteraceae bacterium OM1]
MSYLLPVIDATCPYAEMPSERLASALSSSDHVAFDWNIVSDQLHLTGRIPTPLELNPTGIIPTWSSERIPDLIHPDDLGAFRQALRVALKGENGDQPHSIHLRLRDRAGAWCKVALVGRVVERNADGRALRIRGHVGQIADGRTEDVARNEPLFRQLVERSPDAIILCRGGRLVLINRAGLRLFGARHASQLLGRRVWQFIDPEASAGAMRRWESLGEEPAAPGTFEERWIRIDGNSFDAEVAVACFRHAGTSLVQLTLRDITERRRLQSLQRAQARILSMIAQGSGLREILGEISGVLESYVSGGACTVVQRDGTTTDSGSSSVALVHASSAGSSASTIKTPCASATTSLATPIRGRDKTPHGTLRLRFASNALPDTLVMQAMDVCASLAGLAIESRASEEEMRRRAHYDGLTGLPNRFLFREYLDLALRRAERVGGKFAVLFLDLDKFKEVNDGYGHDEGDAVLREISARLRACLRQSDRIARMGGDEFYVLIDALDDSRYAADVACKLLAAASRPVKVGSNEHRLSVSIGIGIFPEDGQDADTLLKRADAAMYRAKQKGKDGFEFVTRPKLAIVRSDATRRSNTAPDAVSKTGNE